MGGGKSYLMYLDFSEGVSNMQTEIMSYQWISKGLQECFSSKTLKETSRGCEQNLQMTKQLSET